MNPKGQRQVDKTKARCFGAPGRTPIRNSPTRQQPVAYARLVPEHQPIADFPEPPYYAVIFTSQRPAGTNDDYESVGEQMFHLATQQPGYLGAESVRGADGLGITVSYWTDEASIHAWHEVSEHRIAQQQGYDRFYDAFSIRVAKVERQYGFDRS